MTVFHIMHAMPIAHAHCMHLQLLLCFQCLEQVLLFTASPSLPVTVDSTTSPASSASHYVSVGSMLVSTILTSHMRCIYSCLQTSQPMRLVASCLKLLTAMVLQGPGTARDIQQSFNFGYRPLEVLPSRTHLLEVSLMTLLCSWGWFVTCAISERVCGYGYGCNCKLKFCVVVVGVD
jgi:hypothetical protein